MQLSPRELSQFKREQDEYAQILEFYRSAPKPKTRAGLELVCVGNTGGAANVVHGRPSGGFLLRHADRTIAVDPGDNSISGLAEAGFNPYAITDVLASHAHNDHVGDLSLAVSAALNLGLSEHSDAHIVIAPSLIEYANAQATRFGFTLPGYAWKGRVVPLFWRDELATTIDGEAIPSQRSTMLPGGIRVTATEARHGGVMGTGFVFDTTLGRLAYTGDTEFFPGLPVQLAGADVLWINLNTLSLKPRPTDRGSDRTFTQNHIGYVGACELIEEVRPSVAIVSHFGVQLLPHRQEIEALLRDRFQPLGITVHCPATWDSFYFQISLSAPPQRLRFTP